MLAHDIGEMRAAHKNFTLKKQIYTSGSSKNTGSLTLKGLSDQAQSKYGEYPLYNLYKKGFAVLGELVEGDSPGNFDGKSVQLYADTVVNDLFKLNISQIEADASLSFNVAMAYYGHLYDMLKSCVTNDKASMLQSLDKASALWVGADQERGDANTGFLFYSVAQYVEDGARFDQIDPVDGAQVVLNSNVMEEFSQLRVDINGDKCSSPDSIGYMELRIRVQTLVSYLFQLFVQMLLHKIMTFDPQQPTDFVEMYTLTILPVVGSCDTDTFHKLVDMTITNNVDATNRQELIKAVQSTYSCLGITCEMVGSYRNGEIPQCDLSGDTQMVGYTPSIDVRKTSYIDRDIRQIEYFLEYGGVFAARDYYNYGWNTLFSLKDLATGETTGSVSDTYKQAAAHFGANADDRDFIDKMVLDALNKAGTFSTIKTGQMPGYVVGLLRGLVMFLAITNELDKAVELLSGGSAKLKEAQMAWDNGAALFIGSTEGSQDGGDKKAPGASLYGLAKEVCQDFNLCQSSSSIPPVNREVVFDLEAGASNLASAQGAGLSNIYEGLLFKFMIPLSQGMLENLIMAGQDPDSPEAGYAFGYSRAVIAFFSSTNSQQASEIEGALTVSSLTSQDTDTVFSDMETIISSVEIDCEDIGAIHGTDDIVRDVCAGKDLPAPYKDPRTPSPNYAPQPTPAPVKVTREPGGPKVLPPTNQKLGFNKFTFSNEAVALADAKVAQDVKKMWLASDVNTAKTEYENGESFTSGLYGLPDVSTLQKMSTEAKGIMEKDDIYNFYRYALYDDEDFKNTPGETWDFGNNVISLALKPSNGNSALLAAESTVVMNSIFIILRQLNEAAKQCRANNRDDALTFLDSAVGIWIGEEQASGKFNSGYMMYSIAQLAREHFGMNEAEAKANGTLMNLFNKAKTILQNCQTQGIPSFLAMRAEIKEIARVMSIPLVEELLYYNAVGDRNFEEMFAVALVPHIASCSTGDYLEIQGPLFQNTFSSLSADKKTVIVDELAKGLVCLGISCGDLSDPTNSGFDDLIKLKNDLCSAMDSIDSAQSLVGHPIDAGGIALAEARLDLDVNQIHILMRMGAKETAKDIYDFGRNSPDGTALRRLQKVAGDNTNTQASSLADKYKEYFGESNFIEKFIGQLFGDGSEPFPGASAFQNSAAAKRILQALSYLAVHGWIQTAQNACANSQPGGPFIDNAVALFAGSIEGPSSGGSTTGSGVMLMGLGKEVCSSFLGACETTGDASANEFVLFAFADIKQWLSKMDCDSAAKIIDETLIPMLAVPFIQATLMFAEKSASINGASGKEELASLDVLAKAILPQIAALNQTSASTIVTNTQFVPGQQSVQGGLEKVVDAFKYVIRGLGIKCDTIGTLLQSGLSTCDRNIAPHPDTTTTLGQDTTIYKSTTFVDNYADIAKDIKQMEDALKLDKKTLAFDIYKGGENSAEYDKFGIQVSFRSLSGLSTNASLAMKHNPLFQTTVYTLKDEAGNFLGKPVAQYADSIVMEMFDKEKPSTLPAEAAVTLNIWMEVANRLFEAVQNCKNQMIAGEDGIHAMDIVAAYWIGDGETAGNTDQGHLLYNLAERLASKFDTVDESGLASANVRFLRLLNQARLELSFAESCSTDLTTARKLMRSVNMIVSQMVVVQAQGLIDALINNDPDRVRIFAHGLVPLARPCNAYTFDYLYTRLITGDYDASEVDEIIGAIYNLLPCLELTCKDVGTHKQSAIECIDPPFQASLAGYRPSADVADFAALDLDISLLDILMDQEAYEAAEDLYVFGKYLSAVGSTGSVSAPSLEGLAKSTGRPNVPDHNDFVQYYSSDNNYAHTMINSGLRSAEIPSYRRRVMVVLGAQYLVMYMAAQEQMYGAVKECNAERPLAAKELWNRAAAYIVGSIEGVVNAPYDRTGGMFLWGISKKNCGDWRTCRNIMRGSTVANERIQTLLYSGRGAVTAQSCEGLEKAASELTPVLRSILVQATLEDLVTLHEDRNGADRDLHHARAYVGAQSLLPLINAKDRNTAAMISRNLDFDGSPLEEDGFAKVVQGFTGSLEHLGVDCTWVGGTSAVDFCSGDVEPDSVNPILIVGVGAGVLAGCLVALCLFFCRSKSGSSGQQEQATFVRNTKGVLDEADKDYNPESRNVASVDDMEDSDHDASNAANEDFIDVQIRETV